MQPKKQRARKCDLPSPEDLNDNRPNLSNPQGSRGQVRNYPEGWSRWVEPKTVWDVDQFLEVWGTSITALHDDADIDERELRQEADAWGRALHARRVIA